jgi:hypothetical protein
MTSGWMGKGFGTSQYMDPKVLGRKDIFPHPLVLTCDACEITPFGGLSMAEARCKMDESKTALRRWGISS